MCDSCKSGGKPVAAVWWRTSTDAQLEISPETQIGEALALAHEKGYDVPEEYIIGCDWSSMEVWDSPPFEHLKDLIGSGTIHGLFVYHPDRLPSKPLHRQLLRALVTECDVHIGARHGEIPSGDMGELMEFIDAWAKEKQVLRARQGAADGIRDKILKHGEPAQRTPISKGRLS